MSAVRLTVLSLAAPAMLASCGVFGLTTEERSNLNYYKQNSALYYEAERYSQALTLVEKGLEIAPDDYKLLATRAWCYLQQAPRQPNLLGPCERLFDELYDMRSPEDHGVPVLMGLGKTQTLLGDRERKQARALRESAKAVASDDAQEATYEAKASEHHDLAQYHFTRAKRAFHALIKNEAAVRDANKQLMEIAIAQNDYEAAVEFADASLAQSRKDQAELRQVIEETMQVRVENESRGRLTDLIDEELGVRSKLAGMHFRRKLWDRALVQLDAILEMDPRRSNDYFFRANVLEELGRMVEARRDYQKFTTLTKLPPGDEMVDRAYDFIARTRPANASAQK